MPEAFGMVKVGNSACGLAKLTPRSRNAAMAGAVSALTWHARTPSGTNRMRLRGFGPSSAQAASNKRALKDSAENGLWIAGIGCSQAVFFFTEKAFMPLARRTHYASSPWAN